MGCSYESLPINRSVGAYLEWSASAWLTSPWLGSLHRLHHQGSTQLKDYAVRWAGPPHSAAPKIQSQKEVRNSIDAYIQKFLNSPCMPSFDPLCKWLNHTISPHAMPATHITDAQWCGESRRLASLCDRSLASPWHACDVTCVSQNWELGGWDFVSSMSSLRRCDVEEVKRKCWSVAEISRTKIIRMWWNWRLRYSGYPIQTLN